LPQCADKANLFLFVNDRRSVASGGIDAVHGEVTVGGQKSRKGSSGAANSSTFAGKRQGGNRSFAESERHSIRPIAGNMSSKSPQTTYFPFKFPTWATLDAEESSRFCFRLFQAKRFSAAGVSSRRSRLATPNVRRNPINDHVLRSAHSAIRGHVSSGFRPGAL
jgi:hypothetical protein